MAKGTMMRRVLAAASVAVIGMTSLLLAPSASAMGSGNPYEDMQVGVTYSVYQPSYAGGLKQTGVGNLPCSDGGEQNTVVLYGKAAKGQLGVWEGNPICADPDGSGAVVGRPSVLGQKALVTAFCDPAIKKQWKNCSSADVARYGGSLEVLLPAVGSLRATHVTLVTSGKHPVTYNQLVKVARSMTPVAGSTPVVGGMVKCTQNEFANTIEGGLSAGTKLDSIESFACADGWAYAIAEVGSPATVSTYVFEAEGQFWIPKDRAKVCGTISPSAPATRPADSQVPAAIWKTACNTN